MKMEERMEEHTQQVSVKALEFMESGRKWLVLYIKSLI